MNNNEINRIYQNIIKPTYLLFKHPSKDYLTRIFDSLHNKMNKEDIYKYYSIFFNEKISDISIIQYFSIRLFRTVHIKDFIRIIYQNPYINEKIKEDICLFIIETIENFEDDKINDFLIKLYSNDKDISDKRYKFIKEIFKNKNVHNFNKFIQFLYEKYGINVFLDIFDYLFNDRDMKEFFILFFYNNNFNNKKRDTEFKEELFTAIVNKLNQTDNKINKNKLNKLHMFLHEFNGKLNGKKNQIMNYIPPHVKERIPQQIFNNTNQIRKKKFNVKNVYHSKMFLVD